MNSFPPHDSPTIKLRPIISYPRHAQVGKSYVMTIDLQLEAPGAPWPFPEEEYAISCILDTRPFFSYEPLLGREPTIVLHRFGGSYGPAHYRLTAASRPVRRGTISIAFINPWGIPIASTELECEISSDVQAVPMRAITIRSRDEVAQEQTQQPVGERVAAGRTRKDHLMALRRQSTENLGKGEYDVFISYNHRDQEEVREIYKLLKDNGIAPWLDEWDLRPDVPWQPEVEQQLRRSKAIAVFIGKAGLGSWQNEELKIAHAMQEDQLVPIIPVLLPGAKDDESLPSFLALRTWVDFRKSNPDPLERLLWGITGKHVRPVRPLMLISSLGESPTIVLAMYDLLTQREQFTIEMVTVLYLGEEQGEGDGRAYGLVREALQELADTDRLECRLLPAADADSWENICIFLKALFELLEAYQKADERVCLSLAGGRESMAALMAWVAPFFSCVKKLYHVLDPDEDHFPSLEEMESMSRTRRKQALRPDIERLKLVDIPFDRGQHIDKTLRQKLLSASSQELALYGAAFVHDLVQEDTRLPSMPPVPAESRGSVLIVPLGKVPMVATQLYTLLTRQEGRKIREVVLVYPQYATRIVVAAEIVKEALWEEAGIPCTFVPVPGLKDIDSSDACTRYQRQLEAAIDQVRAAYPECSIDLALSGGRKGMTAMTVFAAQQKRIFVAYHTLIPDEQLQRRIDRETAIEALRRPGLSKEERNARLFLRAYEGEGPYTKFLLFPVPIFPADTQGAEDSPPEAT